MKLVDMRPAQLLKHVSFLVSIEKHLEAIMELLVGEGAHPNVVAMYSEELYAVKGRLRYIRQNLLKGPKS